MYVAITLYAIQHHRGRATSSEIWVFGLVDVSVSLSPALGIVPNRTAATLLPIIQSHVAPGTIVHSDQWAAYNGVGSLPNVSTVNHSVTFVDPVTGTHTQHVESYWNRCKTKFKRMKGVDSNQLPSYLDEFMWNLCGEREVGEPTECHLITSNYAQSSPRRVQSFIQRH